MKNNPLWFDVIDKMYKIFWLFFKECENMMMNDPKPEPPTTETLPSRGVLMVNKSRQSSVFMEDSSSHSKPQNTEKQTKKLEMKNVQTGKNTLI